MTGMEADSRFAEALEECARRVRGGEALEACIADYPAEYRAELERLVSQGRRVEALGMDPSTEFQERLERTLLAQVDEARGRSRSGGWRPFAGLMAVSAVRTAVVAVVTLAVVATGVGAVQASEESLPDNPLYQVKTAREWLRLTLAQAPEARAAVQAEQVGERGRELRRAVQANRPDLVARLARDTAGSVERLVDQALRAREQGHPNVVPRTVQALRQVQPGLEMLIAEASPETRPILVRLRAFLERQEQRLRSDEWREGEGASGRGGDGARVEALRQAQREREKG